MGNLIQVEFPKPIRRQENIIACTECGNTELLADYQYCPRCTADLSPLQTVFRCCGGRAIIEPSTYCPFCGSEAITSCEVVPFKGRLQDPQ